MGGIGSGSYSDESYRGGRRAKAAINVCGTGVPTMPNGLSADVQRAFQELVELTSGVTFQQDSRILLEGARLIARQDKFAVALETDPTNDELNRLSLAIGRQLTTVLGKLGLTPRDRQVLLIPRTEEVEDDPLEILRRR